MSENSIARGKKSARSMLIEEQPEYALLLKLKGSVPNIKRRTPEQRLQDLKEFWEKKPFKG